MPPTPGYKVTRDGGLIIHPSLTASDQAIQIPNVSTAYGAGFGESITDSDRAWAAQREPIGHFLTYGVSADITEKWFTINDPDTEEADPALDRTVQDELTKLDFKRVLTDAISQARIYRKSLLVCGFNDAKTPDMFRNPRRQNAELLQLSVYPNTTANNWIMSSKGQEDIYERYWSVESKDENPNSPRYLQPVIYKLYRGANDYIRVHYTRVVEVDNEQSVLDSVWDDMTCGRNIRWGASQWLYRTGGGFPVLSFPAGTTAAQLEAWGASGAFTNLMSRTYILLAQNSLAENDGMTFEFKGPAGSTLDPQPFFQSNVEQIAIATGIPQAKLVGAQAGAVTGSDVNMQDYYKVVSREQSKFEYVVRWVLDRLAESGQIKIIRPSVTAATDYHTGILKNLVKRLRKGRDFRHKSVSSGKYVVEWKSAFELSEKDEAQIEFTHAQTLEKKLAYMSKDEVRAEEGLDPLPDGAGEWKDQSDLFGGGEQFMVTQNPKKKEQKPNAKNPTEAGNQGDPNSKGN